MAISARDRPRHRALVLLAHLRRVPAVKGESTLGLLVHRQGSGPNATQMYARSNLSPMHAYLRARRATELVGLWPAML